MRTMTTLTILIITAGCKSNKMTSLLIILGSGSTEQSQLMKNVICLNTWARFNIKMPSYQYRKSHCGDKTVVRSSYLHNWISYTGKMTSLYWIRALNIAKIFSYHTPTQRISRRDILVSPRPSAHPSVRRQSHARSPQPIKIQQNSVHTSDTTHCIYRWHRLWRPHFPRTEDTAVVC